MTARILEVTEAEYFADPCEVPSLTKSIAHTLITRSPAHAWTEHPRFGNCPREPSAAKNDGSIIHALLLGKGVDVEIISGFGDFKKKAAREARDAAKEAGRIPILEHKYAALEAAAETLRRNIARYGIELRGDREIALEWREQGAQGDVVCRGKMDLLQRDTATIIDVKKISQADLRTCQRQCYEYAYDIQHAAYTSAVGKLLPEFAGRVDFIFVFVELEPPYAVVPARAHGTLRELGQRRWQRAVQLWEHCLAKDWWPTYTESITTLEAPHWALTQEEMYASDW